MIRFNKHFVTNGEVRARVHYSLDNRVDGRKCVTLYAKDYTNDLATIFPAQTQNDSDSMTDYFETGRVVLFEGNPLYVEARKRVEYFRLTGKTKCNPVTPQEAERRH